MVFIRFNAIKMTQISPFVKISPIWIRFETGGTSYAIGCHLETDACTPSQFKVLFQDLPF